MKLRKGVQAQMNNMEKGSEASETMSIQGTERCS
jgi:hypothetical protein